MRKPAAAVSVVFHGAALLVLFALRFEAPAPMRPPADFRFVKLSAPPRRVPPKTGGGGQRQPLPASRGRAPVVAMHRLWVPPMVVVHTETPKLVLEQALVEAPEVNIQSAVIGDPLGRLGIPSGGPGGPLGIGDHGTGGIGNGPSGPRQGGVNPPLKLTRQPQVIYQEEPEYSDEARKARHEGIVILAFDVDLSGRPVNIRVVRSLGLGLDEKAMAAVARWKFRPAVAAGHPVVAPAQVEVTFRLL